MNIRKKDILTPANAATVLGLLLTLVGSSRINTTSGIILVGIGRALDLVDGPLARRYGSSRLGAAMDGTADKLATLAIIIASFYFNAVPIFVLAYVLVQNLVNAAIVIYAEYRKRNPESSILGKRGMFFQNLALVLFMFANTLQAGAGKETIFALATASVVVAVPLGLLGSKGYMRHAIGKSTT